MSVYYVYLLRCEDDSLYTGITTDPERRLQEHRAGSLKSKYTRAHRGLSMEAVWKAENRSVASQMEYRIKRLSKEQKEALTQEPQRLVEFLPEGTVAAVK